VVGVSERLGVTPGVFLSNKEATCPLPECGAVLRISVTTDGVVYADGTADPGLTSTWTIGCEQGHVLLLPPDTGVDYYSYDEADSERLRNVIAPTDW
jgi:hypothetical protein